MGKKYEVIEKTPKSRDLQEWLSWLLTQDADHSPALDNADQGAGQRAARNQGRYSVWFIPGTVSNPNKINRVSTVPANVPILIMAATSDASPAEFAGATDSQLLEIAKQTARLHRDVNVTITDDQGNTDTYEVKDAKNPKPDELKLVETEVFPIIFPEKNIYEPPITMKKVRGGYSHLAGVGWGITVVLQPGVYTLMLKAKHDPASLDIKGLSEPIKQPSFNLDIEYKLTAIGGANKLPFNPYPD